MTEKFVPVDNELKATLSCGTYAFPFELYMDDLVDYSNGFVNWHWQTELEISYVLEGGVELQVLEKTDIIRKGQGFMVMPGCLHTVKPIPDQKSIYFTLVFDLILIYGYKGSQVYQKYVDPVVNYSHEKSLIFKPEIDWQNAVLKSLLNVLTCHQAKEIGYEIAIIQEIGQIWMQITTNIFQNVKTDMVKPISVAEQQRITTLMNFIKSRYADKITLYAIACSASISRGECCRFFQRMIHMTPFQYLMQYRIIQSLELIQQNELSIVGISEAVGFSSVNYFTTTFRKQMNCSPREYRKMLKEKNTV